MRSIGIFTLVPVGQGTFDVAAKPSNELSFSSTPDLILLSASWRMGYPCVYAEVNTDVGGTRSYHFKLAATGDEAPDHVEWKFWCTLPPNEYPVGVIGPAHLYVRRESPRSDAMTRLRDRNDYTSILFSL